MRHRRAAGGRLLQDRLFGHSWGLSEELPQTQWPMAPDKARGWSGELAASRAGSDQGRAGVGDGVELGMGGRMAVYRLAYDECVRVGRR